MTRRHGPGRQDLVARAEDTRRALLAVHDVAPPAFSPASLAREDIDAWETALCHAYPILDEFHRTVRELRRDRLARRMAQAWEQAGSLRWWYRTPAAASVEATAWDYLQRLPAGTCPRRGPRESRRALDAVFRELDGVHADDIDQLTRLSRQLERQ